jgi:hypothetical protein
VADLAAGLAGLSVAGLGAFLQRDAFLQFLSALRGLAR